MKKFFQGSVFLYFTKVAAVVHSSIDTVFFRGALAVIYCVYAMYLTGFGKVFSISVAGTYLINDPFSVIKKNLQACILSNILCLCRTRVQARRYRSY